MLSMTTAYRYRAVLHHFIRFAGLIGLVLLLAFSILLFQGHSPADVLSAVYSGTLASDFRIANTLNRLALMTLVGLTAAVPFSAGIWNVGGEGQITIGAFAAALVGFSLSGLAAQIHVTLAILAAMLAGAVWAAIPAVLKLRFHANEIVTTIMMNYIAIQLTDYLANYPFRAPNSPSAETPRVLETAQFAKLISLSNLNTGIFAAIIIFIFIYYLVRKSALGYEWRTLGKNPLFARYGGIQSAQRQFLAMCVGGALAGLVGSILVLGIQRRFIVGIAGGLGFTGALIALVAVNSVLVVLVIAAGFALIQSSVLGMEGRLGVAVELSDILQSIIILLIIAREAIWSWFTRLVVHIRRAGGKDRHAI